MYRKEAQPGNKHPSADPPTGSFVTALRFFVNSSTFRQIPRLLREGPAPIVRFAIQLHNTAEIINHLEHARPVNFITSFPRSGNNWLRYLLADILLQNQGIETSTALPVHPDKIVPDIYCNWVDGREEMTPPPGLLIKTHQPYGELRQRFGATTARPRRGIPHLSPFRRCKFIYLYRSPEDALVSFYHYAARSKQMRANAAVGIDAFCLARLAEWENNMGSYLRAAEDGASVLFVPYELLLQYPVEIFGNILRWLGISHESANVERAVSNMEFTKLQVMEAQSVVEKENNSLTSTINKPFAWFRRAGKTSEQEPTTATVEEIIQESSAHLHFRVGAKGSGRAELQPATVAEIQDRTGHLAEMANSRVMTQQSLHGSPATTKSGQIRVAAALQRKNSRQLPASTKMRAA
jgi:hypothetical protein